MFEDTEKDIFIEKQEYAMVSLFSNKIRVGIVGIGRAAFIKAHHFVKLGAYVLMISKDEYSYSFLHDKHIVIIAVNDEAVRDKIREDCDNFCKIYIDCSDFKKGLGVVPSQRETENIILSVNTRNGNPKGSVYLADSLVQRAKKADKYIEVTTSIRNKVRKNYSIKKQVLDFIFSEDFRFFFEKGQGEQVLKIFFEEV